MVKKEIKKTGTKTKIIKEDNDVEKSIIAPFKAKSIIAPFKAITENLLDFSRRMEPIERYLLKEKELIKKESENLKQEIASLNKEREIFQGYKKEQFKILSERNRFIDLEEKRYKREIEALRKEKEKNK